MLISQRPVPRHALAAALVAVAVVLAGCSAGSTVADHLPTALGGLPDGTPQRPDTSRAYPAVHDMPPPRATRCSPTRRRKSSKAIWSRRAIVLRKPLPRPLPTPTSRDKRLAPACSRSIGAQAKGAGVMEEFYRIRRLPPYVFEQVNRAK